MIIYKVLNIYTIPSVAKHFRSYLLPKIEDIAINSKYNHLLKCNNNEIIYNFCANNKVRGKFLIFKEHKDEYFPKNNICDLRDEYKSIDIYDICLHNGLYIHTNADFYLNIKDEKNILQVAKNILICRN